MKIKTDRIDDELLFKRLNLSLGDHSISTPIKASENASLISPVNEIHRRFSGEQLKRVSQEEAFERRVNQDISKKSGPYLNFFFVDYNDITLPSDQQLEALSDVQYEHSDVVTTPLCSQFPKNLQGDELIDSFLDLTSRYLDIVNTLNNKTIIGAIPSRMPRQFLNRIIDLYYARGATSFVIDLDGRSLINNPSWIRHLMRIISSLGILEDSFIYSINASEGKFMKNANVILAKDFITTGYGIDILGLNHVQLKLPSEQWTKIKEQRRENVTRIFDRDTYGYRKQRSEDLARKWKVPDYQVSSKRRAFNIKEQYEETLKIQSLLSESTTIEPYVTSKNQVEEKIIKDIKKLRRDAMEETKTRPTRLF